MNASLKTRKNVVTFFTYLVLILGSISMIFPFVWMVLTSFKTQAESMAIPPQILPSHWNLDSFVKALQSLPFTNLYINTGLLILFRVIFAVVFSSMAGYAFAKLEFPCKKLLFSLVLIQMMLPSQIFIIPQYQMLAKMGPINMILYQFFGVAVENLPRWAAGKDTAMITVILFSVWKNMGYYMVIYLAGLQGCNPDLNEAAELDGANRWQQFWHITLPQLRPTTFFVVIMLTISGFKVYDQMYMITQGGPGTATMTLVYYIYNVAFVNTPKYGYASAIAMVLFVLVLIVTVIQFRGSKGDN